MSFSPLAPGSIGGALALTDNNQGVANAMQSISLSGIAPSTVATTTSIGSSLNLRLICSP